jgi:hypothetical protein
VNFRRNNNSMCFLFFSFLIRHYKNSTSHTQKSLFRISLFLSERYVWFFAAAAFPAAAGSGRLAADQQSAAAGQGIPHFSHNALTAAAQMKQRSGSNAAAATQWLWQQGSGNGVIFRKEWYRKTGKEVMEGRPLLHRLLGFKKVDVKVVYSW